MMPLLKQLVELNKAQRNYGLPPVPDVQQLVLSRRKVHTFRVTQPVPLINTSTTLNTSGALSFTLNSLPNSVEFTALFDQWRIVQAIVKFNTGAVNFNTAASVLTVIDYDDDTSLASASDAQQYGTLQVNPLGTGYFDRTITPQFSTAAYSGAFTSFASADKRTWVDVASPGVRYYGLKYFVPPTSVITQLDISIDVIVQFRENR